MTPTPEWIILIAPFASGAVGAGLTAGLFWGVIKQKVLDHERRISETEKELKEQVGEDRCDKMRGECRQSITNAMTEIKTEILANRTWVTDRFQEIARFMGAHNGVH